jgi:hypothetical protein
MDIREQLATIREHNAACACPAGFISDAQVQLQKLWSKEKEGKVCTTIMKEGKRHLMSHDGMSFTTYDISGVSEKDLFSVSSQETTFDQVQEKLSHFKGTFSSGMCNSASFQAFNPDEYKLDFIQQGKQVVVPATPGTIIVCILAKMYPTYYDFSVYDAKNESSINFSDKRKDGNIFQNSGDRIVSNTLLQFAMLRKDAEIGKNGHRMATFVTGYSATPLEKFHGQAPANLLFDHQKKIIHIIEFPLDKATVGSATCGVSGSGEFKNGFLYFDVFNKPETGMGYAPSYNQPETNKKLKTSVQRFTGCKESASIPSKRVLEEVVEIGVEPKEMIEKSEVDCHSLLIEIGQVKGTLLASSHLIKCVGGIACYLNGQLDKRVHTEPPNDLGSVILPGLLGPIEGPFICLTGHPIQGDGVSPHQLEYFRNCFPIITVSTKMKDAARQTTGNKRINGLFIIEPEGPVDTAEKLAMVNKNVLSALAGPKSLVLVKHGDTFLYLEGISLKGILDKIPEFGEPVPLDMTNLLQWSLENTMDNPIVDITNCMATLGDQSFTLEQIISMMKSFSLDDILGKRQSILCLFYQLTKIHNNEELQGFAKQVFDILDKILTAPDKNNKELKKLKEDFEKGNTTIKVSPTYRNSKEAYTKKRNQLRFLMDKVSSLIFEKDASSKALTHKQLKRFNAIQVNVERFKTMDRSEFVETVEDSCSMMGVLVSSGDSNKLKTFLDTIGKKDIKEKLISETLDRMKNKVFQPSITGSSHHDLLQLSSRMQMLDALTATCILEITAGSGPLRSVDNSMTLAIPEANSGSRGAVLLPLMDIFVNMKDPYTGNWINLCNNADVAMFRLLMRRTFIKASIGRDLTPQIDDSSTDLGWGMVNIYLDLMHQLSAHRTTPMTEDDFDDTLCQQIRCLFGLSLTQLAAGQDPISLIWQLWRENSRPDQPMQAWHWPLYLDMAYLMQFTGWSQEIFRRNLKILLIRTMNSKIAYPMCKVLRAGKEKIKGKENNSNYEAKLQGVYYPAKKSLTKNLLNMLEKGELPRKEFLVYYENIFNDFTNQKVRKAGIKTILRELQLMILFGDKYHEESRHDLIDHLKSTLKKYEPKLKICRLDLKRTLMKALSENKAPDDEKIKYLSKDIHEVEESFDKEKNVIFNVAFRSMKKLLVLLSEWNKNHRAELNISKEEVIESKELAKKMYRSLKFDCWNMDGVAHNEEIQDFKYSEVNMDVDESVKEEEKDVVKKVTNLSDSETNSYVSIIVDANQPALERVSILAKMMKIDNASVLTKLAGFAGFGTTDEEITGNLCFTLHELFQLWHVDPPVLEKIIADKI